MKEFFIVAIVFVFVIFLIQPKNTYTTTIHFKQTYSSGYTDSSSTILQTEDSAKFEIFYHSPEKYFPSGAFYLAADDNTPPINRHYVLPSVIKVEPYFVSSVKNKKKW